MPRELSPVAAIPFPHILGISNAFVRLRRFLNRRELADSIGREVAAACLATYRGFGVGIGEASLGSREQDAVLEQQAILSREEGDWLKSVWGEPPAPVDGQTAPERLWASTLTVDSRIAERMRLFEITTQNESAARAIVVPEEMVEGWIKGKLRGLYRWAAGSAAEKGPVWDGL